MMPHTQSWFFVFSNFNRNHHTVLQDLINFTTHTKCLNVASSKFEMSIVFMFTFTLDLNFIQFYGIKEENNTRSGDGGANTKIGSEPT